MKLHHSKLSKEYIFLGSVLIISTFLFLGYWGYRYKVLSNELSYTREASTETTEQVFVKIKKLEADIAQAKITNENLLGTLTAEQKKNFEFEEQIKGITNTVVTLEKLSKTDKQFLEKYSKIFFLNEHYVPSKLTLIDQTYLNKKDRPEEIHAGIWPFLQKLLADAQTAGVPLQIVSAYRSFGEQTNLKSSYDLIYGSGTANTFSAEQGYSEHQLGTTVDFTTEAVGGSLAGFENTTAYAWLQTNAHRYGFILSYPKGNGYYQFEPWHWRFVSVTLATRLHNENKYFYENTLTQREIDQYLVSFFDN